MPYPKHRLLEALDIIREDDRQRQAILTLTLAQTQYRDSFDFRKTRVNHHNPIYVWREDSTSDDDFQPGRRRIRHKKSIDDASQEDQLQRTRKGSKRKKRGLTTGLKIHPTDERGESPVSKLRESHEATAVTDIEVGKSSSFVSLSFKASESHVLLSTWLEVHPTSHINIYKIEEEDRKRRDEDGIALHDVEDGTQQFGIRTRSGKVVAAAVQKKRKRDDEKDEDDVDIAISTVQLDESRDNKRSRYASAVAEEQHVLGPVESLKEQIKTLRTPSLQTFPPMILQTPAGSSPDDAISISSSSESDGDTPPTSPFSPTRTSSIQTTTYLQNSPTRLPQGPSRLAFRPSPQPPSRATSQFQPRAIRPPSLTSSEFQPRAIPPLSLSSMPSVPLPGNHSQSLSQPGPFKHRHQPQSNLLTSFPSTSITKIPKTITTTLTTSFAHPINFKCTIPRLCTFHTDYRHAILGHGRVTAKYQHSSDEPSHLTEIDGGHIMKNPSLSPDSMCVGCATSYLQIIRCAKHTFTKLAQTPRQNLFLSLVPSHQPTNGTTRIADNNDNVGHPALHKHWSQDLYQPPPTSNPPRSIKPLVETCNLCLTPASHACHSAQTSDKTMRPCRLPNETLPAAQQRITKSFPPLQGSSMLGNQIQAPLLGCGLKLCTSCHDLVTNQLGGKLQENRMTVLGAVGPMGRADIEFLFRGGLVWLAYHFGRRS